MNSLRHISLIVPVLALSGCNLYEDYFTTEGQYFRTLAGVYSLDGVCDVEARDETAPDIQLADYYSVNNHNCGIKSLTKDNDTFTLEPFDTCSILHRISDSRSETEEVPPIKLTVKRLSKAKIETSINGAPPEVFLRCG